jgi:hypothetical protein
MQEVAVLAECRSANITEYYASVMLPGTTELLIIMELMASSVNDLVSASLLLARLPMREMVALLEGLALYWHNGQRLPVV